MTSSLPHFNPSYHLPRSGFVSGLAILSAAIAASLFVSDLIGITSYLSMMNSPTYRMAMGELNVLAPGMNTSLFNSTWVMTTNMVSLALNAGSLAVSIGLFRRKEWGRRWYIVLVVVQTIFFIGSSLGAYYWVESMADTSGFAQLLSADELLTMGLGGIILGSLVGIAISVFVIIKLRSASVRAEFLTHHAKVDIT
ncbi:MAG TPA: hypothetical protein VMM58_11545 [Bacteroidota bacterium]|nr:hypothetical protein [Bacteroidota bacterium]